MNTCCGTNGCVAWLSFSATIDNAYSRGSEKTWVYGGLRVADGQTVTCTAPSRNSVHYQRFLSLVEQANPTGEVVVITDNLSSHTSVATREWLAGHPRLRQVFIPRRRAG